MRLPPAVSVARGQGPREAGRLARYYAACYVEIPWDERQQALAMLMEWFGEQMTEWIAGECARAGLTTTTTVPEAEVGSATAPGLPREEPGPREQEPQPQPQAVSPTMDIYHECAAEECKALVCNGGERQHMQSPYCSDACWHEHAKDGRVHGPADTKAWAEDTTNALWRRGRLTEANVGPRRKAVLRMDIKAGDPLSGLYHEQRQEQEEACRAQKARRASVTASLTT